MPTHRSESMYFLVDARESQNKSNPNVLAANSNLLISICSTALYVLGICANDDAKLIRDRID